MAGRLGRADLQDRHLQPRSGVQGLISALRALRGRIAKRRGELAFWQGRRRAEGELANFWYERAWTEAFGIPRSHYAGKRVLDVGCGPRGSLEWADDAAERVGADPLARRYAKLNGGRHAMRYVPARAESLPFPDGWFDVVGTFNALDHVEDVDRALAEMVRVLAPGGDLLVAVDVEHEPTHLEPWRLEWDLFRRLEGVADVVLERRLEQVDEALYVNLERAVPFDPALPGPRAGLLAGHLRKR